MTDSEKINLVITLSGEEDEDVVSAYLFLAEQSVLRRMYEALTEWPEDAEVPDKYHSLQCTLAARYLDRRGGEGQMTHSENGISRTWESPDDADVLRRITPLCEVPK